MSCQGHVLCRSRRCDQYEVPHCLFPQCRARPRQTDGFRGSCPARGGCRGRRKSQNHRAAKNSRTPPPPNRSGTACRTAPVRVKLRCVQIMPRHLPVIDLEAGDCRYPYGGDADGEAITFCGHPQHEGSSYCIGHFQPDPRSRHRLGTGGRSGLRCGWWKRHENDGAAGKADAQGEPLASGGILRAGRIWRSLQHGGARWAVEPSPRVRTFTLSPSDRCNGKSDLTMEK